jgi:hypothetical protein
MVSLPLRLANLRGHSPLTNHVSLLTNRIFLPLCRVSLSSIILWASSVHADENYFAYSFGSETLPHNRWELYSWTTGRFGKGIGSYSALDFKQEVETKRAPPQGRI